MLKAGGAIIIAKDTGRVLLQYRSDHGSYTRSWGFWGGKIEPDENVSQGMLREISEELGDNIIADIIKVHPLDQYHSRDGEFSYYTFAIVIKKEIIPSINDETGGYAWTDIDYIPRPLHPGAKRTLFTKRKIDIIHKIINKF